MISPITLHEISLIPLIIFGILFICELNIPKFIQPKKHLHQSYSTNMSLFLLNCLIITILSSSSFLLLFNPIEFVGLLGFMDDDIIKVIVSFALIDLFLYYWHRICHKYEFLWVFHKVHHNDEYLNLSTSFRSHFVELILTNILKTMFIVIIGIDQLTVFVNEIITTSLVMFHHSNIKVKGESFLKSLIITPSLHHTHHSKERVEHDSNYGAVFSIWDRYFGTLSTIEPIFVGVKGYSPQTFVPLLKFGVTISEPIQQPTSTVDVPLDDMIAVAAYYKAEQRGFNHGNDQKDWFEAQQEISNLTNICYF